MQKNSWLIHLSKFFNLAPFGSIVLGTINPINLVNNVTACEKILKRGVEQVSLKNRKYCLILVAYHV